MTRPRTHKNRRITDEQIQVLRSWVPFGQLARSMGIAHEYARRLRKGTVKHKTRSP